MCVSVCERKSEKGKGKGKGKSKGHTGKGRGKGKGKCKRKRSKVTWQALLVRNFFVVVCFGVFQERKNRQE